MSLVVLTDDHPVLKMKSEKVEAAALAALDTFMKELVEVMKANNGIGIAAPQVGVLKQIIVINTKLVGGTLENEIMINPVIVKQSHEKSTDSEGCLSLPGKHYLVQRRDEVFVSYMTPAGKTRSQNLSEIDARCVQHEVDHLRGILMSDVGVPVEDPKTT